MVPNKVVLHYLSSLLLARLHNMTGLQIIAGNDYSLDLNLPLLGLEVVGEQIIDVFVGISLD